MAQETAIEWTDVSWNPTHGCSIASTECRNCYAMELSLRYGQTTKPWTPANAAENVLLKPHKLREPLSNAKTWRGLGEAARAAGKTDGKLVFVNSTSDLFHEQIPDEYIAQVFDVMARAKRHTFQVLTKRPERMRDWARAHQPEPLSNVWLGTSIGLRQFAGRADHLRATPAAVRFISAEPLLGPLFPAYSTDLPEVERRRYPPDYKTALDWHRIDWVIVGGESGANARPMDQRWAADILLEAERQRSSFERGYGDGPPPRIFVKQLGRVLARELNLKDRSHGGDIDEWPEHLRVREMPAVRQEAPC